MQDKGVVATHSKPPLVLPIAPSEPFYCFIDGEESPVFIVRPDHVEEDSMTLRSFFGMEESQVKRLFELFVTR